MFKNRITGIVMTLAIARGPSGIAATQNVTFDNKFPTDYSGLVPKQAGTGMDFAYIAPQAIEKVVKYEGIVVDGSEVLSGANSEYTGAKLENIAAIADSMLTARSGRLKMGNYNVVDQPGPGILYIRVALTNLDIKNPNSCNTHRSEQW